MAIGNANALLFKDAEAARDAITLSQKKQITALYNKWADKIGEEAKRYGHMTTQSSVVQERYAKELRRMLRKTSEQLSNEIYGLVRENMYLMADEVVQSSVEWMAGMGFSAVGVNAAMANVPDQIVRRLVTGQIYDTGWSLSGAIWGNNEKVLETAYEIVAGGIAQQKPIYKIAEDLKQYVQPGARKDWNLVAADGRRIYPRKVDYAAQRLARTLVQHSYQQSFESVNKDNPFVLEYIWRADGSRVCEICAARDGVKYKKGTLPLDHPNGMCSFEPVVDNKTIDKIADWFAEDDGTFPEIDKFARNFGWEPVKKMDEAAFLAQYGKGGIGSKALTHQAWLKKLPPEAKITASKLKEASGQGWATWYNENIFNGSGVVKGAKGTNTKAFKAAEAAKQSGITTKARASFDDLFDEFADELNKATNNGTYLGQMSKQKFIDSLGVASKAKIGDDYMDEFVHKAFEKMGAKSGHGVSNAIKVKTQAEKKAAVEAEKQKAKKAAELKKQAEARARAAAGRQGAPEDVEIWLDDIKSREGKAVARRIMNDEKLRAKHGLTEDEIDAITRYTGSSYDKINGYARNLAQGMPKEDAARIAGIPIDYIEDYDGYLRNIKSGLDKVVTEEPIVLRRGNKGDDLYNFFMAAVGDTDMDYSQAMNMIQDMKIDELRERFDGAVGKYNNFVSTSSVYDLGFQKPFEFIFYVPEGVSGSSIMSISKFGSGEGEFLLNSGFEAKIVKITGDRHMGSRYRVFVEILAPKK